MTFDPVFDDPGAPLPAGDAPSCGNRRDVRKIYRVHRWAYLGLDVRHVDTGELLEVHVRACGQCGTDQVSRSGRFGRKLPAEG